MRQFWREEELRYWPKEQGKVPMPVRLERARRRLQPYLDEWNRRKFQIVTGSANRPYPRTLKQKPIRRWVDWKGTVQKRSKITPAMHPIEYFPCFIKRDELLHYGPEEMKWFLDGLKARHVEFEEMAMEYVLNRLETNPKLCSREAQFKTLIQGRRAEWNKLLSHWVLNPMEVFKPLYWWNAPKLVQERARIREEREKAYAAAYAEHVASIPQEWYYGPGIEDPLGPAPPEEETDAVQKAARRNSLGKWALDAENKNSVPKEFVWMVNPEMLEPLRWPSATLAEQAPTFELPQLEKIVRKWLPRDELAKFDSPTMGRVFKATERPWKDFLRKARDDDIRYRANASTQSTVYTRQDQMESLGCLASKWTEKVREWIQEMKFLSETGGDHQLIQNIIDNKNPFIEAILNERNQVDIAKCRRLWPVQARPGQDPGGDGGDGDDDDDDDQNEDGHPYFRRTEPPSALFRTSGASTSQGTGGFTIDDLPVFDFVGWITGEKMSAVQEIEDPKALTSKSKQKKGKGKLMIEQAVQKGREHVKARLAETESTDEEAEEADFEKFCREYTESPLQLEGPSGPQREATPDWMNPDPQDFAEGEYPNPNSPMPGFDDIMQIPYDVPANIEINVGLAENLNVEREAGAEGREEGEIRGDRAAEHEQAGEPAIVEQPQQQVQIPPPAVQRQPSPPPAAIQQEQVGSTATDTGAAPPAGSELGAGSASRISGDRTTSSQVRTHSISKQKVPLVDENRVVGDARFDSTRFGDEQKQDVYRAIDKRPIVMDVGFEARNLDHPHIREIIQHQGWQEFARHYTADIPWELIREFFANLDRDVIGRTWVRGTEINYSGERINAFYRVPPPYDFVGTTKKLPKPEAVHILNALVGGQLNDWLRTHPPSSFSQSLFDARLHPFIDLFNAKLRPTSNTRVSSIPRMYPLYRVLEGSGRLNVGAVITENIFRRTTELTAPLCYPGLIYQLCIAAGVDLGQFITAGARTFTLGNPIPIATNIERVPRELFTQLACFDDDVGAHIADTMGPKTRKKPRIQQRRGQHQAPPAAQPSIVPPAQTSLPSTQSTGETPAAIQPEQPVQPPPPPQPPVAPIPPQTAAEPTVQQPLPSQSVQMPLPSQQPSTMPGTSSGPQFLTFDMMMAVLARRNEEEARRKRTEDEERERRREEKRRTREEERRREEEERRREREEERKLREEENRRRDEEWRRMEEDRRRRDELMMKQYADSQMFMQNLMLMMQPLLPQPRVDPTVPAALALPVQPTGSTDTPTRTTSDQQPSQSTQTTPATDPPPPQP